MKWLNQVLVKDKKEKRKIIIYLFIYIFIIFNRFSYFNLRSSFLSSTSGKHAFRVTSTDPSLVQSFTFVSSDEHDKKQWMQMIGNTISLNAGENAEAD